MEKKLLFLAALAGAVTLGSCVKDDESASVTAVRNAKAAQLNSEATLNEAMALYRAAQAAHEQADAAYRQAEVEWAKADARVRAAAADAAEMGNAVTLATLEDDIATAVATAKNALLNAQQTLAATAQSNDATVLRSLYTAYTNTQTNLLQLKAELIDAERNLALANVDKDYYAKGVANTLLANKKQLIIQKAKLEVLQNSEYQSMDDTELQAKILAKNTELNLATAALPTTQEAKDVVDTQKKLGDLIDLQNEMNTAKNDVNNVAWTLGYGSVLVNSGAVWSDVWPVYTDYNGNPYAVDFNSPTPSWYTNTWLDKDLRIHEENSLYVARALADLEANAKDALGKDTDTDTTTQSDGVTPTAYAVVAAAKKAMDAAKALPESTDAEKATKKAAVEAAEVQVAQANDNLAQAKYNAENAASDKAKYEKDLKLLDPAEYNAMVTDLEAAIKAAIDADDTFNGGVESIEALEAEIDALQSLSSYDLAGQIALTEASIENLEKTIAEAEANVGALAPTTLVTIPGAGAIWVDYDSAIEYLEATVEYYKNQIKAKELEAETYLKQMAVAAGEESTDEPTDEPTDEGGEG